LIDSVSLTPPMRIEAAATACSRWLSRRSSIHQSAVAKIAALQAAVTIQTARR
jgi:hypothetical protein